jgi:hypothetical protein
VSYTTQLPHHGVAGRSAGRQGATRMNPSTVKGSLPSCCKKCSGLMTPCLPGTYLIRVVPDIDLLPSASPYSCTSTAVNQSQLLASS